MKIITILSVKGGTGKTTLSSNLAVLLSKQKKLLLQIVMLMLLI